MGKKKRPNGSGSCYQRKTTDLRWVVAFPGVKPLYFNPDEEDQARVKLAELRSLHSRGKTPVTGRGPEVQVAVAEWKKSLPTTPAKGRRVRKALSPATIRLYEGHVDRHLVAKIGHRRVSSVTTADLEDILRDVVNTPVQEGPRQEGRTRMRSDASIQSVAKAINHFFNWTASRRFVEVSPAEGMVVPVGNTTGRLVVTPTPEQFRAMVSQTDDPMMNVLAWVLLGLGGRISERLALRWQDIDWRTGEVRSVGKGDKENAVLADPEVLAVLRSWRKNQFPHSPEGLVFPSTRGTPLDVSNVEKRFARAFKKVLPGVHPQALRRARATWAHEAGVPLAQVSSDLNHSDLRVTQRYLDTERKRASSVVSSVISSSLAPDSEPDSSPDSNVAGL